LQVSSLLLQQYHFSIWEKEEEERWSVCACMCVCVWEREKKERDREREKACECECVYVLVRVSERVSEREIGRERQSERESWSRKKIDGWSPHSNIRQITPNRNGKKQNNSVLVTFSVIFTTTSRFVGIVFVLLLDHKLVKESCEKNV